MQQSFQTLFPSLPEYSRCHCVHRNAEPLLAAPALSVITEQPQPHLIDSKPLPVAKGKRVSWAKLSEASKGFSTMGMVFGFKLHALTNEQGLFEKWAFAPANHSDVTLAQELLEGLEDELVLGDKAYIGCTAYTPKRKNMALEHNWQAWMSRTRKRLESSFSSLVRSLTLHAAQVKTFASLKTRVNLSQPQDRCLQSAPLRYPLYIANDVIDTYAMFDPYLSLWALDLEGDPIITDNSRLLPVRYQGQAAMLKIAVDPEEKAGAALMLWWAGEGAAHVLAHEGDALLLERSYDSGTLATMAATGQDDEASRIICAAAARLHAPRNKPLPKLVPLATWFEPLWAAAAKRGGILRDAAATARELLAEPQEVVALHGDIHHGNILDFGSRGWLAIDPKGLLGERGYDFANTLCNPNAEVAHTPGRMARQVQVVAEAAGLDRRRLLKWILAYGGLSESFYLKDDENAELDLTIAEMAAAALAET